MTREEAIHRLKNTAWLGTNKDREETEQAVDMAIEALSNNITESPNDVVEPNDDVIKKPKTVRYKLHKPIEYVSIEFDEEEEITQIGHYTAYEEKGVGRYENAMQKLREMPRHLNGVKEKQNAQKAIAEANSVVRCKDCKNWRESNSEDEESYCYIDGRTTDSTGYCSWGERKEP